MSDPGIIAPNELSGEGGTGLIALAPGGATAAAATRCDQGQEILVNLIQVTSIDTVKLQLILCKSAFRVVVHLDTQLLLDQSPVSNQLDVLLGPLSPGLHSLSWSYLAASSPWKVLSEVLVNGLTRFRQRKGDDSNVPFNHSFLFLQVQ